MSTLARTGHFTHDATAPPAETSVFSLLSLKGRVAIVTGGSRSIGLAASHALAEAGADVAIWYKQNEAAAAKSAEEIARQWGVKCKLFGRHPRSGQATDVTCS